MDPNIVDFQKVRDFKSAEIDAQILDYYLYLPPTLTPQQCSQGRNMLAWSREALAFRSGASVKAIREFESGSRELRTVTRQALAYALEAEGLLFFPGFKPVKSNGCPGATLDPRQRNDFYLIE
jgi:DNA-binding transcriptional regulator YiaG